MIVCTVASNKQLPFAIVMARSIKKYMPKCKVVMCLVEKTNSHDAEYLKVFDKVILANQLGFPNFERHIFKHQEYEGPGSCKAWLLQYAINEFQEEDKFIYLDSDTRAYGPFIELESILKNQSIILTPHAFKSGPHEISFLKNGAFNSGFIALKRSQEASRFLNWWANRLEKMCYIDYKKGIYGDQRYLDLAPALFDVYILRHPGYNAGFWNLYERHMVKQPRSWQWRRTDVDYTVQDVPLRFYHFGAIGRTQDYKSLLKGFIPDPTQAIYSIYDQYKDELTQMGYNPKNKIPWSYNYFQSGERISPKARLKFRNNPWRFASIVNPFLQSNKRFRIKKGMVK